jgi:small acid-soluble spore protein (thioredoxin-like protein)
MAKPDDRSDNAEKLQEAVQNTLDNLEESEHYLSEHSEELNPKEANTLQNKNKNRREAVSSMKSEIQDESNQSE